MGRFWQTVGGLRDASSSVCVKPSDLVLIFLLGLFETLEVHIDAVCKESIEKVRRLTADTIDAESDASSESGSSAFSSDSVKEILQDLQMETTCLLDIGPLLSDPIVLVDAEPVRRDRWEPWNPSQVFSDKISTRFPEADHFMVRRLGKTNYDRYLRCQEIRNQSQSADALPTSATDAPDGASSKFHDSGIGSSLPTTYAETVMSYGADEVRRVRLPPLPAQAKDGASFECVCCGKLVTVRTNSAWKQHIYADLQPWICLEIECSSTCNTFPTRKDWVSHLALDHRLAPDWVSIKCPLCQHNTASGKLSVTAHLSNHLEEISLAVLPTDCGFDEETAASELEDEDTDPETEDEIKAGNEMMHNTQSKDWKKNHNTGPTNVDFFMCQDSSCLRKFDKYDDLAKHEKTHSRPWKCPVETCQYSDFGWSLEHELARHYKDSHSAVTPIYQCQFPPCPFESKRESDCIQHARRVHNREYSRSQPSDGSNFDDEMPSRSWDASSSAKAIGARKLAEAENNPDVHAGPTLVHNNISTIRQSTMRSRSPRGKNDKDSRSTRIGRQSFFTQTKKERSNEASKEDTIPETGEDTAHMTVEVEGKWNKYDVEYTSHKEKELKAMGSETSTCLPRTTGSVQESRARAPSLDDIPLSESSQQKIRKDRREYPPSSWGFDRAQMTMKKRVVTVFDGPRRLEDDLMALGHTEFDAESRSNISPDRQIKPIKAFEAGGVGAVDDLKRSVKAGATAKPGIDRDADKSVTGNSHSESTAAVDRSMFAAGPSSYWSVKEQNAFPDLLETFGTDWQKMSAHMKTKTPTMVSLKTQL